MRKAILSALLLLAMSCSREPAANQAAAAGGSEAAYDLTAQRTKFADVRMNPDLSFLDAEERHVVNLLIRAADLMNEIYLRQVHARNPELRQAIASSDAANRDRLLDMFDLHFGVWDTLAENRPFFGSAPLPVGAGLYPEDLTRESFDAYLAAHPDEREALTSPYTVVRRQGDRLVAIPYSQAYRQWLEPAARLLEQAADITRNASLRRFLALRAQAFRSNDYYPSELAWMEVSGTPIEVVIGPYEVYIDQLHGQKTAFEAFVTVKNPRESAALERYKALLPDLERSLPVEARYRNANRPFDAPILVAELIHTGGEARPGVQTVAFNLPNDERVREAKGAKKVILSNVLGAKYERILAPMAALILVPDQARRVSRRYMTQETLFHELSHSLGPGTIEIDGRRTTVNAELRDLYSASEECKADVMGMWSILHLMGRGELPAADREEALATYAAGLFRSVRFGIDEAHGRGAALQYSYLRERGALGWDESTRRFRIDYARMAAGIRDLVAELVRLQGNGDYRGTRAFFDRYARLDDQARAVLASTSGIPTDIRPIYPSRV
jgi:hypothetical protein